VGVSNLQEKKRGGRRDILTFARHGLLPDLSPPAVLFPVENGVEVVFALVVDYVVDACVALAASALGGVDGGDGGAGEDHEFVWC
jgi:hypothetical protein